MHLGRGTLRAVADAADASNRYYDWAVSHRGYHFSGQEDGAAHYRAFSQLFDSEVGAFSAESLVAACRRKQRLSLKG